MNPNTDALLSYIVFFTITFVLIIIPFIPAWKEFKEPTDFAPLPISVDYAADILFFANKFSSDITQEQIKNDYAVTTAHIEINDANEISDFANSAAPVVVNKSVFLEKPATVTASFFFKQNFLGADQCTFNAMYACGSITMGKSFRLLQWAHAKGFVTLASNSILLGRLSSDTGIRISSNTCFERLYAPSIFFGHANSKSVTSSLIPPLRSRRYSHLPRVNQRAAALYLVHGDCALATRSVYRGSLVVSGNLTINEDACVVGDIKVKGNVFLLRGAKVDGTLIASRDIEALEDVYIKGPLISEGTLQIGSGCLIGDIAMPTSVISKNIVIKPGALVHGTIRARHVGMVL